MARDLLQTGAAWLSGQLKSHAAQVVVYQRGESSIEVRASLGRSEGEQEEGNGLITRFESRDYLIDVADLLLDDVLSEPLAGDRIIEGPLEEGKVYQVAPIPGRPVWEYADAYRNKFRIHTKFVGRQPPVPE
jgi:hypothetical protein